MAVIVKRGYTDADIAVARPYVAVRSEVKITRLDSNGRPHLANNLSIDDAARLLAVGSFRSYGPNKRSY